MNLDTARLSLARSILHRDAQRPQKADVLRRKRLAAFLSLYRISRRLLFNRIQSNRRFQHQHHIETLLTNFLYHSRDLRRFGD